MTHQDEISVKTSRHGQMTDITSHVSRIVSESGVAAGIANIFNIGSTGVIGTVEFEPGLCGDIPETLDRLVPAGRDYGHENAWHDGNAHSHIQATMMGPSLTVPVSNGSPILGTWQQIFHLECDIKPRTRTIVVTVIGE